MANGLQTMGTKVTATAASIAITLSVTAGDTIFLVGSFGKSTAIVSGDCADTAGNTWVLDKSDTNPGSSRYAGIYRCQSAVGTASITITVTVSFGTQGINAFSWRGVNATPVDVSSSGHDFSSAGATGSTGATAQASELVIAAIASPTGTTPSNPAGGGSGTYTNFLSDSTSAGGGDYLVTVGTGTQAATWTVGSGSWGAVVVAYKLDAEASASGAVAGPVRPASKFTGPQILRALFRQPFTPGTERAPLTNTEFGPGPVRLPHRWVGPPALRMLVRNQYRPPLATSLGILSETFDAVLALRTLATQTFDAALGLRTLQTQTFDAALALRTLTTQTFDATLTTRVTTTATFDAALALRTLTTQTADAALALRTTKTHTFDTALGLRTLLTQTFDAAILAYTDATQTWDASLALRTLKTHTYDALLSATTQKTQTWDADFSATFALLLVWDVILFNPYDIAPGPGGSATVATRGPGGSARAASRGPGGSARVL